MDEDLVAINESLKKQKIINFYKKNKKKIYLFICAILILIFGIYFYSEKKNEDKKVLADNYIQAKQLIKDNQNEKAKNILKGIILKNDKTYSSLSLFLLLDSSIDLGNLEIIKYFDHIISKNSKLEAEEKNLLIYKKAIFISDFSNESLILQTLNPLINSKSVWSSNSLVLLGDYFLNKGDLIKSKEFYEKAISSEYINKDVLEKAKNKLKVLVSG